MTILQYYQHYIVGSAPSTAKPNFIDHSGRNVHARRHPKVLRLTWASPSAGENFYLRVLLLNRPARSLAELRCGFSTLAEACIRTQLLEEDMEWDAAMSEAVTEKHSAHSLRRLFVLCCLFWNAPAASGPPGCAADNAHDAGPSTTTLTAITTGESVGATALSLFKKYADVMTADLLPRNLERVRPIPRTEWNAGEGADVDAEVDVDLAIPVVILPPESQSTSTITAEQRRGMLARLITRLEEMLQNAGKSLQDVGLSHELLFGARVTLVGGVVEMPETATGSSTASQAAVNTANLLREIVAAAEMEEEEQTRFPPEKEREQYLNNFQLLNSQQRQLFLEVAQAIDPLHTTTSDLSTGQPPHPHEVPPAPAYILLQAKAGTGKTFLMCTLANFVRSLGKVCLCCAFTGIAAREYPGGKTLHATFQLPLDSDLLPGHTLLSYIEMSYSRQRAHAAAQEAEARRAKQQQPLYKEPQTGTW
jgi:hypothetical protein